MSHTNISEQIQNGQHHANQIIEQVKQSMAQLKNKHIAISTFKEELEAQLLEITNQTHIMKLQNAYARCYGLLTSKVNTAIFHLERAIIYNRSLSKEEIGLTIAELKTALNETQEIINKANN